ncbi:Major facilitator superfamily domain, general substrate transporter [Cordyceps fumosorosea ARSEF 2679]|uniref:Major facilitator superfamily domain, general substrate transporter n=1 Tax=Cordyceps fumosorosea (strain ARSEF 2679) TaxID=1081104 RepID=A0A162K6H2_CORFA|nr:Major facilitator superfamily domain, general substrate transporter [Cordyceps fumosorosea ARSEF 2679]OAA53988.1 Major facilitator superfamily domain, general substrate transporter [Cordyceps fumosorosea ARSEF 2679]
MAHNEATQNKSNAVDSLHYDKRNSLDTVDHVEIGKKVDQGSDMKVYGHAEHISYTKEEHDQVLRRIDWILLPMLAACYMFSFLDKTLLNYGSIFGLTKQLHLKGTNYSWLGSIFYIGYMVGVMVWAKLVQLWPQHAGKFITGAVLAWSTIILLTPLCFNFAGIAVARLCLGLVESIIGPVFVIVTSNWWTRREQAFRTAFWLSGTPIGNFIGGLLTYGLGKVHGSISTWKIFYLFFGSFSFVFGLVLAFLMPDNQTNARWLDERQKKIAIERVRQNRTVTADDRWKWPQFWEALRDPQTILFFVTAVGNTMPSTFASQFSSQVVTGFGFTPLQTTLVSTCPAATIQFLSFIVFSWLASRYKNISLLLCIACSVPPLIGACILHALPAHNQAGRLAGYYLTYTHSLSFTLNTGLIASNYAGNTKKTTASGLIFAGWAAGLIAGPQFFLARQAPVYELAFRMLMGCYSLMIVIPVVQIAWYRYENSRRERLAQEPISGGGAAEPEFTDKSDFEQWETFRYIM